MEPQEPAPERARVCKDIGNRAFRAGMWKEARAAYSAGVQALLRAPEAER